LDLWEYQLNSTPVSPPRDRWARLRFSIIGSLLAAPPDPGTLQAALTALAARTWRDPEGLGVQFGVSTLERWYYAARRADDPIAHLRNRLRTDVGHFPSVSPALADVNLDNHQKSQLKKLAAAQRSAGPFDGCPDLSQIFPSRFY